MALHSYRAAPARKRYFPGPNSDFQQSAAFATPRGANLFLCRRKNPRSARRLMPHELKNNRHSAAQCNSSRKCIPQRRNADQKYERAADREYCPRNPSAIGYLRHINFRPWNPFVHSAPSVVNLSPFRGNNRGASRSQISSKTNILPCRDVYVLVPSAPPTNY